MENVFLALIEWGKEHYWFFGWTLFWGVLASLGLIKILIFSLPNRILRTIKVCKAGWPPIHLDADGDWKSNDK